MTLVIGLGRFLRRPQANLPTLVQLPATVWDMASVPLPAQKKCLEVFDPVNPLL